MRIADIILKRINNSRRLFFSLLLLGLLTVPYLSGCSIKGKEEFIVKEHLNDTVVKINDEEFTLEDIGYYIANGEAAVEAQALVYNPDNPLEYWNKHTNGIFVKVQARQNVMDSFVRDEVLALEAKKQGITLSDAEKENCKTGAVSLFEQLNSFQKTEAGITQENLEKAIEKAYYGQKYISWRLENDGSDKYTVDDWQVGATCYKALLNDYKVKVIDKVWEEVEFGKITIQRD